MLTQFNFWNDFQVIDASLTDEAAYSNYKGAVDRGISKIMAKMGISVLQSYKGAQVLLTCLD